MARAAVWSDTCADVRRSGDRHGGQIAKRRPGRAAPGLEHDARHARSPSVWGLAAVIACTALAASAHAASPGDRPLSNPTTYARWARTLNAERIFRAPSRSSRAIARLRFNTEDGLAETYLLL